MGFREWGVCGDKMTTLKQTIDRLDRLHEQIGEMLETDLPSEAVDVLYELTRRLGGVIDQLERDVESQ